MGEDNLKKQLIQETEKWLNKLETLEIELLDDSQKGFAENIKAYLSDARYFFGQHDYVRAFEAVVWAWAWLEIGERLGLLRRKITDR